MLSGILILMELNNSKIVDLNMRLINKRSLDITMNFGVASRLIVFFFIIIPLIGMA